MKLELNLADTFTVTSREKSVTVDIAKLGAETIARAALHGIKQKIADAAAGAAKASFRDKAEGESADAWAKAFATFKDDPANESVIADKGLALMQKALDKLVADGWTAERGASEKLSALDIEAADAFGKQSGLTFTKGEKTDVRRVRILAELATRPEKTQLAVYAYAQRIVDTRDAMPVFDI